MNEDQDQILMRDVVTLALLFKDRVTAEGFEEAMKALDGVDSAAVVLHTIQKNLLPGTSMSPYEHMRFEFLWGHFCAEGVYGPLDLPEPDPDYRAPEGRVFNMSLKCGVDFSIHDSFSCVCRHETCHRQRGSEIHEDECDCPKDYQFVEIMVIKDEDFEGSVIAHCRLDEAEKLAVDFTNAITKTVTRIQKDHPGS
jgi:hypothetical protein